jgi:hypothetical protein
MKASSRPLPQDTALGPEARVPPKSSQGPQPNEFASKARWRIVLLAARAKMSSRPLPQDTTDGAELMFSPRGYQVHVAP